jgi:hypothetical protein
LHYFLRSFLLLSSGIRDTPLTIEGASESFRTAASFLLKLDGGEAAPMQEFVACGRARIEKGLVDFCKFFGRLGNWARDEDGAE